MRSKHFLSIMLSTVLAISSIQTPVLADEISDNQISIEEVSENTVSDTDITTEQETLSEESIPVSADNATVSENKEDIEESTGKTVSENNIDDTISNNLISANNITKTTNTQNVMNSTIQGLNVKIHTEAEIRKYLKDNWVNFDEPTTCAIEPVTTPPYAPGQLSEKSINSTLRFYNNIRYIAGLNDDVSNNIDLSKESQAAALITWINNVNSHAPKKPEGMDEDLYQLASKGCAASNIGGNTRCLNEGIIGMINENDDTNFERGVGHRRAMLLSYVKTTGLGWVQKYESDGKSTWHGDFITQPTYEDMKKTVVWPSTEMPLEYFECNGLIKYEGKWTYSNTIPWTYDCEAYFIENKDNISVKLTRKNDNKTWTFSKSDTKDGRFKVNDYGVAFNPDYITYNDGDRFHVEIYGLPNGTVTYDVHFFKLENTKPNPDPDPTIDPSENIPEGVSADHVITNRASLTLKSKVKVTKWVSSDKDIATVKKNNNKSCIVKGKTAGNVTITGYDKKNVELIKYTVTVETPKLTEQLLNHKTTLSVNSWIEGSNLYKPTKYTSSNKKILLVDKTTGEVQVLKNGKATITVYFGKGKISKTYKVTMPKPAKSQIVVKKNQTKTLPITNYDASLGTYSVSSNNPGVTADVNSDGTITISRTEGKTAILTLFIGDIEYGKCKVLAKKPQ